jgi:hypothetical protein
MTEFLRNPPSWIVAILMAVLTAHALDRLIEVVTRHRRQNGVIPILEIFIVMVLSFLAIHAYYEGEVTNAPHQEWYDRPFALVIALVFFGLSSVGLYLVSRPPHVPRAPRKK